MSYRIKLDSRAVSVARFISRLQKALQDALVESGLTQQQVATALSVDRSVVNRRLKGSANLTARSIADLAFVLGKEVRFELQETPKKNGSNWSNWTANANSGANNLAAPIQSLSATNRPATIQTVQS